MNHFKNKRELQELFAKEKEMNIEEMKCCPFCGMLDQEELAIATKSMQYPWCTEPVKYWAVGCSCGAYGPLAHSEEKAKEHWNRRVTYGS